MFNLQKYRKYLVLGCLAMAFTLTPVIVRASISSPNGTSIKVTQNLPNNNISEEVQIEKALLIDAKKQNWYPKIGTITIVDDYAIATTFDENTGGESILKKQLGGWKVIGGTGGAFSKPEELVQIAKVPLPTARRLLSIRARQQR